MSMNFYIMVTSLGCADRVGEVRGHFTNSGPKTPCSQMALDGVFERAYRGTNPSGPTAQGRTRTGGCCCHIRFNPYRGALRYIVPAPC
jgi:hypothetical protein